MKWSFTGERTNSIISSAAINSEGNVFVGSMDGKLIAFGSKDQITNEQIQTVEEKQQGRRDEFKAMAPLTDEEINNTYYFEELGPHGPTKESLPGEQGHTEPKHRDSPFARFLDSLMRFFGKSA